MIIFHPSCVKLCNHCFSFHKFALDVVGLIIHLFRHAKYCWINSFSNFYFRYCISNTCCSVYILKNIFCCRISADFQQNFCTIQNSTIRKGAHRHRATILTLSQLETILPYNWLVPNSLLVYIRLVFFTHFVVPFLIGFSTPTLLPYQSVF